MNKIYKVALCSLALAVGGAFLMNSQAVAQDERVVGEVQTCDPFAWEDEVGSTCKIIMDRDSGRSKGFGYQIDVIAVYNRGKGPNIYRRCRFEGTGEADESGIACIDTVRTDWGIELRIDGVIVDSRDFPRDSLQGLYYEASVKTAREAGSGMATGRRIGITVITKDGTEMTLPTR